MRPGFTCILLLCLGAGCAARAPVIDKPPPRDEAVAASVGESRETPVTAPAAKPAQGVSTEAAAIKTPAAANKPATPWQQTLERIANADQLRQNAHYFPRLAWLSARWCSRDDRNVPVLFYNVDRTPTGFLNLHYGDRQGSGKRYNHVHIEGSYFDLWDEYDFSDYLKGEGGRRLEKRSDDEFALVYVFAEKPRRDRYDRQVFLDFTARRAREVGADDHLLAPRVFIKCD